jgi:hypothetical protein
VWVVVGVGRSFGTLPLSVPVALLPPREQAYENPSSITLISFGIGHCRGSENNNFYLPKIGCVSAAVFGSLDGTRDSSSGDPLYHFGTLLGHRYQCLSVSSTASDSAGDLKRGCVELESDGDHGKDLGVMNRLNSKPTSTIL